MLKVKSEAFARRQMGRYVAFDTVSSIFLASSLFLFDFSFLQTMYQASAVSFLSVRR